MDEALLLNEIRKGDPNAFNTMFIAFYSPLCEYTSQFISNENAEELVQNLMLYVWEERGNLTVERSLRSYLFASARNRALNAIRDNKYRQKVHSVLYEKLRGKFENPDYYMADDLSAKMEEIIDGLPESYRETFRLSRFGEMTNTKIASMLGVSVKTVEYRISRSLKILRTRLKELLADR
jgi:RNA polymerase sigma-70 factor (ECF subfamily)